MDYGPFVASDGAAIKRAMLYSEFLSYVVRRLIHFAAKIYKI